MKTKNAAVYVSVYATSADTTVALQSDLTVTAQVHECAAQQNMHVHTDGTVVLSPVCQDCTSVSASQGQHAVSAIMCFCGEGCLSSVRSTDMCKAASDQDCIQGVKESSLAREARHGILTSLPKSLRR